MSAALVIPCEDNYWPGAEKLIRSFDDNTTYKYDLVIISRTIDRQIPGMIIRPQTPKGNTVVPWLTDSFTWFEALKLHHGTLIIMDADQLVVGDVDALFDMNTGIHMGPDPNGKYCTGLVVVEGGTIDERRDLYDDLVAMIPDKQWKFGDQSLVNEYVTENDIHVNMLPAEWQWLKMYGDPPASAKILHWHGQPKPWEGRDDAYAKMFDIWAEAQR